MNQLKRETHGLKILENDIWAERIPHEEFKKLRENYPVAWFDEPDGNAGFWAVTRHSDLVTVHRDFHTFSSQIGGTELEELEHDIEAREARRTMLETDPPEHTRIRRITSREFTRRAISKWEVEAKSLMAQILEEATKRKKIDFVESISRDLPIKMLTKLLGIPEEDSEKLFHWADAAVYHSDPDFSDLIYDRDDTDPYRLLPFRSPSSLKVFEYAKKLAESKMKNPEVDIVSMLVASDELTEQEFLTFFLLLVIAGNETTRHGLSHGALALAKFPKELDRLKADPSLIDTATEEILRWSSPQAHFRRTALFDTEIEGVKISKGDKVVTWYISANYDEKVFDNPFLLDITRSPNPHVTFGGGGPHICLGAWLARLEIKVFLEELSSRVTCIKLEDEPTRIRSNFINGLKSLPVTLVV